jgi:hypothetical protein
VVGSEQGTSSPSFHQSINPSVLAAINYDNKYCPLLKYNTMTSMELKNKVINKIRQINDDEILKDIYKLLDDSVEESETMSLSKNHRKAIEKAKVQIENGDYLTNEQSNNAISQWLNKQ